MVVPGVIYLLYNLRSYINKVKQITEKETKFANFNVIYFYLCLVFDKKLINFYMFMENPVFECFL